MRPDSKRDPIRGFHRSRRSSGAQGYHRKQVGHLPSACVLDLHPADTSGSLGNHRGPFSRRWLGLPRWMPPTSSSRRNPGRPVQWGTSTATRPSAQPARDGGATSVAQVAGRRQACLPRPAALPISMMSDNVNTEIRRRMATQTGTASRTIPASGRSSTSVSSGRFPRRETMKRRAPHLFRRLAAGTRRSDRHLDRRGMRAAPLKPKTLRR